MSSIKGKPVVIFGGSGFIGRHLAASLADDGAAVTIADRTKPVRAGFKFNFHKTDITRKNGLEEILRGNDYAVNLAAAVPFSQTKGDYLKSSIDINIIGAANIARACLKAGIKKLIFVSGYVVYGLPRYLPMDELHPLNPLDFYGISKLAAEQYLQALIRESRGLDLVLLRLSSVYGPGQISQGLIPNLIRAAISNTYISINGGGKARRDYLYIDDAVSAIALSLKRNTGGVFNIASGESFSVNQVKNIIETISGARIKTKPCMQKSPIGNVILSYKLAEKYLGFEPAVSLEDGLAQTYKWNKGHWA